MTDNPTPNEIALLREGLKLASNRMDMIVVRAIAAGDHQNLIEYKNWSDDLRAALAPGQHDGAAGEGLTPRERVARVIAWEHFGIAWEHMEIASHVELLVMVDQVLEQKPLPANRSEQMHYRAGQEWYVFKSAILAERAGWPRGSLNALNFLNRYFASAEDISVMAKKGS